MGEHLRASNSERGMVFDEAQYRKENPDVHEAIEKGSCPSAFTHYLEKGITEQRGGRWKPQGGPRILREEALSEAPLKNTLSVFRPWEGNARVLPWEYPVTVAIPVLGMPHLLERVIPLLRLQTLRPYIVLIDTGSAPEDLQEIEKWRDEDIEVHQLRLNGVQHPSDFPAMAMDLAFTVCRTPYMFCTHMDCFLRRQDLIADMAEQCKKHPVVGYELSPRGHEDWKGMVGHTCTMLDMQVMDQIGANWSQRRLCVKFGISDPKPDPLKPNWPDTELLLNYILRDHKIKPLLIGGEENFQRTLDSNIDHCRTIVAGKLYSPDYYKKASLWLVEALQEAEQRIEMWRHNIV